MGVGMLTPFNAVVSAGDFYAHVDPDYPSALTYLSLGYNAPSIPTLAFMILVGEKIPFGIRILTSLCVDAVLLLIIPFVPSMTGYTGGVANATAPIPPTETTSYAITFFLTVLVGISTSVLQTSLF